jgi:quercetin dioxygenase-like cupin family protein
MITMFEKIRAYIRSNSILCAGVLCAAAVSLVAFAGDTKPTTKTPTPAPVLFSVPLPDVPGKNLVVVPLKWRPATEHRRVDHHHPGSVYVYVTEGTVRLGIEGQPVQEVHAGQGFFEPPGALHTVAESASATQSASAIAVMIVPEGAPLVTREDRTDTK